MDVFVTADGRLKIGEMDVPCALGPAGLTADKCEGDGATPIGAFPIRRVLYRPDKGAAPKTDMPTAPIAADDGWCDAPGDANYNRPVKLPYPASAETMWRDDHVYDICVILGHNDDPPVPGKGSAIFFHLAREDYSPTEGCVAVSRSDMEKVLALLAPDSKMRIGD